MKTKKRIAPVLLALIGLLALPGRVTPAGAHANLVRSDPASGAVLATAPAQVQCWFSEQPDPHFSDIQVLDANRKRVDAGDMHVAPGDPLSLIVGVHPLSDGLYTVSWKTVSAVDGHVVNGNFPFYVGQPPQGAPAPVASQSVSASSSSVDAGAVADRWLSLLSAVVLFGGFAFPLLVLGPAWRAALAPRPGPGAMAAAGTLATGTPVLPPAALRRARRLLLIAWSALAVAAVIALLQNARAAAGVGVLDAFGGPLRTVLLHTRFGRTWWLRAGSILAAGALLLVQGRTAARERTGVMLGSLGLLAVEGVFVSYSLNSHGAALGSDSTLATLSDLVHLTAAGLWLGGLVQLVLVVPAVLRHVRGDRRRGLLAELVPRFSTLAMAGVALLVVTGVYQAYRQLPGWPALWESGYGRTLDVKLLLILPLLALGAVNLLVVKRALQEGDGVAARGLSAVRGRLAGGRIERTFLTLVGLESLLGVLIFGVVALLVNQPPPQRPAAPVQSAGLTLTSRAEGDAVTLAITPGGAGLNHFQATVTGHGKPPPDGTNLVLRLTYQDADLGTSELPMTAQGGGRFAADSSDISTYGRWQITALVQPPAADEVRMDFALAVSQTGGTGSGRAASGNTSVQRGRQLYAANCAQCHGAGARGDGPEAKKLDPPPVDLVVHVPQHSDQQLLDWITNGIPATAMPAFGKKLSADDRQAVLNYLRQLSPGTAGTGTPQPGTPSP